MFKSNLKIALCAFIASIILGICTVAFATELSSNWKNYGPINGYSYRNQATVRTAGGVQAETYVERSTTGNVPVGYLGAKASLYDSYDRLYNSTGWDYSIDICHGMYQVTTPYDFDAGYYYSKGQSAAYNGDGYSTYATYATPNLKWD